MDIGEEERRRIEEMSDISLLAFWLFTVSLMLVGAFAIGSFWIFR